MQADVQSFAYMKIFYMYLRKFFLNWDHVYIYEINLYDILIYLKSAFLVAFIR